MSRCLLCHDTIYEAMGWRTIFLPVKERLICSTCEKRLERIEGETCRICSRPFSLIDDKFRHGDICHDCLRWEEDSEWHGFLEKNTSIFHYNEFFKEIMAKYKYRGDYVLSKAFAKYFKDELQKTKFDFYLPIPLSEERLYERGFNQAEALIRESGFIPTCILTRIHTEKQSKKSRKERIHFPQVFQLHSDVPLNGKRVVLIDDIYTTGSTLRHAAKLLKEEGVESVISVTLAR